MPTDLPSARKREAQPQAQTDTAILLVFVIICVVELLLLSAEQNFLKAAIELVGR